MLEKFRAWLKRRAVIREEKAFDRFLNDKRRARRWRFVNAYNSLNTCPDTLMSYSEALQFMTWALRGTYVRDDLPNSIIFFADANRRP